MNIILTTEKRDVNGNRYISAKFGDKTARVQHCPSQQIDVTHQEAAEKLADKLGMTILMCAGKSSEKQLAHYAA